MIGSTRPSDHIRALVSGYGPSKRGSHLMAVIQAFVDDSGNSDGNGNPVFVLAGYVSSAEKWTAFSDAWDAECDRAPKIENFKMAHANAFRGDFDGWRREDRDARLGKLAEIIRQHTVLRIQTSMAWDDYNAILRGNLPGLSDSPYVWLFWRLISDLTDWQKARGLCQRVDFIFDDQGSIGAEAVQWFQVIRDVAGPDIQARVGSVTHKHDSDVLPLKAADMWAWHVRRYLAAGMEAQRAGRALEPKTELMKGLMHCPAVGEFLEQSDVHAICEAYNKGVIDALSGVKPPWEEA